MTRAQVTRAGRAAALRVWARAHAAPRVGDGAEDFRQHADAELGSDSRGVVLRGDLDHVEATMSAPTRARSICGSSQLSFRQQRYADTGA